MPSPFELLLLDVARQAEKAATAAESTLRRVEQASRDIFELNKRLAFLEEATKWTGEERRKVSERLGSGDHTFQKLQTELELMKRDTTASLNAVKKIATDAAKDTCDLKRTLLRRDEKIDSRRWHVMKLILQHSIPLLVSGLGTAISLWFMKGGFR